MNVLVLDLAARMEEHLLDRGAPLVRQQERLRDVLDLDRRLVHTRSANHGDSRRKSQSAKATVARQNPIGAR
jgi:hypothetical protein